jgi:hypothetical protein
VALPCLIVKLMLSFSAKDMLHSTSQNPYEIKRQMILIPEILFPHRVKLKIVA